MSRKSKRLSNNKQHDMSDHDKKVIELLNIQAQAIKIYLIADGFFYEFAAGVIDSAEYEYSGGESDGYNGNILLAEGTYLSLLASLVISNVSFIAYDELMNRSRKGLVDYSTAADEEILAASKYTVLLYYVNSVGAAAQYYRGDICDAEVDEGWIEILKIQLTSYIIRMAADYLTLSETLEGIELVKSKYSNTKIDSSNIQDPDEVAIVSAILYLIQRVMLFFVSIKVYEYITDDCGQKVDADYFTANEIPIVGSIIGIIADIFALDGFIKIYRRNVDRPVFGR